jgi:hypothetical protein
MKHDRPATDAGAVFVARGPDAAPADLIRVIDMTQAFSRGSCLCGNVRFVATLPTKWVAHCHCSFCRRAHGAPFVTWAGFRSDQVAIDPEGSAPTWYDSSPGASRGFCAGCGSPMFFKSDRWPGEMHVARALFADALDRDPTAHVYYENHVPWLSVNDDLPKKRSTG